MPIVHGTVATIADQTGVEINKGEWNATHTIGGASILPTTDITTDIGSSSLRMMDIYWGGIAYGGTVSGSVIDASKNTLSNIGFGEISTDIITGQTTNSSLETTTDYVLVFDGSAGTLVKSAITNISGGGSNHNILSSTHTDTSPSITPASGNVLTYSGSYWYATGAVGGAVTATYEIPIVMEGPNDAVAFPDMQALATSVDKIAVFNFPDGAATGSVNWKTAVAMPLNLASTSPAVRVFYAPLTAGSSKQAAFAVKSKFTATTASYDQAFILETTGIVNVPATTYICAYYEQTLTTIPTGGEHLKGILMRDPTNASDTTASLMVTAMSLLVSRTI